MVVRYLSSASGAISLPVTDSAPALFTSDGSGWGQAAAVNQDNSINAPSNPAHVGDFISLYATGAGQTYPAGVDGKQATTPYPRPLLPVSVTVGGQPASVLYVGAAPGEVAGMLQINVRIPSGIQVGNNVPVGLQVWNNLSQPKVTIAVSH
jgi:trimeric autotransporter adhesin